MLGKNDLSPDKYKVKYLGGHSAFSRSQTVHLVLTPKYIGIPEMSLTIPLNRVEIVRLVKEEKLATSLLSLPWKKIKKFLMITYEDEANFEENMVFDVDNNEEVKTATDQAKTRATIRNC